MFTKTTLIENNYLRVITYINNKLVKLCFLLWKDIFNHKDINLVSFFNCGILCFIFNIYSDNQQNTLKYLKNTEINLNNILIITSNFNIRNSNWNLSYPHHSIHTDTLYRIADSLNLYLSISTNSVGMLTISKTQ